MATRSPSGAAPAQRDHVGCAGFRALEVDTLLADTGSFSAANVDACNAADIEPLIAMGRQPHHPPVGELFCDDPEAPENPTPVEAMAHRQKTRVGRDLYALRKQIPEPVFGIIKSVMGFRQFMLRGIDKVRGECRLVTMKRMFVLCPPG
jgi:Transposase DDE domain